MKKILKSSLIHILIPITILMIFSILNMYNARFISSNYSLYFIKQIIWFLLGFLSIIIICNIKPQLIFKYSHIFYILSLILLTLVLFFGKSINGTKAWFDFKYFSFQPSEVMKLSLIIHLSKVVGNNRNRTLKGEFKLIMKVLLLTLIPAILTFLEPDTGAVIIYFIIALSILFTYGIRARWFIIALIIITIFATIFFLLYMNATDTFIKIFGTNFFYRMDRIIDFKNGSGMQLDNALIAIGSAPLFGTGIHSTTIYFPEAPSDFIYALSVSNFGSLGGLIIIITYTILFLILINKTKKMKINIYRLYLISFISMFIFQTIWSISMNLGMLPIMGITLPFLSYGGTSTIIYFISIGIIARLCYGKEKYPFRIFHR